MELVKPILGSHPLCRESIRGPMVLALLLLTPMVLLVAQPPRQNPSTKGTNMMIPGFGSPGIPGGVTPGGPKSVGPAPMQFGHGMTNIPPVMPPVISGGLPPLAGPYHPQVGRADKHASNIPGSRGIGVPNASISPMLK